MMTAKRAKSTGSNKTEVLLQKIETQLQELRQKFFEHEKNHKVVRVWRITGPETDWIKKEIARSIAATKEMERTIERQVQEETEEHRQDALMEQLAEAYKGTVNPDAVLGALMNADSPLTLHGIAVRIRLRSARERQEKLRPLLEDMVNGKMLVKRSVGNKIFYLLPEDLEDLSSRVHLNRFVRKELHRRTQDSASTSSDTHSENE